MNAAPGGRPAWALLTLLPLCWLLVVTVTAGVQKIFHPSPRIGFLAAAQLAAAQRPALEQAVELARTGADPEALASAEKSLRANRISETNQRVDVAVTGFFLVMVGLIVGLSVREWWLLLARRKSARLSETEPVWLPDYKLAAARTPGFAGWIALGFALARELAGETAFQRAKERDATICAHTQTGREKEKGFAGAGLDSGPGLDQSNPEERLARDRRVWVRTLDERYRNIRRCC